QNQDLFFQDIREILLSYKDYIGNEAYGEGHDFNLPARNLGKILRKVLQKLDNEGNILKQKNHQADDELDFLKKELTGKEMLLKKQQERCDRLICEHEQNVVALSSEAKRAQSDTAAIQTQMDILQEQTREQVEKFLEQIAHLESNASQLRSDLRNAKKMYKDKIEDLSGQLLASNCVLTEVQRGYTQHTQELDSKIHQLSEALMACEEQLKSEKDQNKQLRDEDSANSLTNEHLQRELYERSIKVDHLQAMLNTLKDDCQQQMVSFHEITSRLKFASSHLESTNETLKKTKADLEAKSQSLDNAERNISILKINLQEKEQSLRNAINEIKSMRSRAEHKKREKQQLKTEAGKFLEAQKNAENLKLQLTEKDHMMKIMQDQAENLTQMLREHSESVGVLKAEKAQFLEQLIVLNQDIQTLKTMAEEKDTQICELETLYRDLELEKISLINSNTEKVHEAKELRKEKDQLLTELNATQKDFSSLADDYEILKRNYENRHGEEDKTYVLKIQLQNALSELEQTKNTLRVLENCDGHAIKVAMRMQKKITAKRGQIDELQSRLHLLEERLSHNSKEKHQLKEEKAKLIEENTQNSNERQILSIQIETLKSENINLKGNVVNMESTMEKLGVIRTLQHRAENIPTSTETKAKEINISEKPLKLVDIQTGPFKEVEGKKRHKYQQ
ncbi:hypothetical protein GDO86_000789, partial [Hymenochirus boettgeri]